VVHSSFCWHVDGVEGVDVVVARVEGKSNDFTNKVLIDANTSSMLGYLMQQTTQPQNTNTPYSYHVHVLSEMTRTKVLHD
jgi:hypothetical protein